MIQFNLLPDVKLEYIKAERTKRFVTVVSLIASAASLTLFVALILTVDVWQKKTMSDLTNDIKTSSDHLRSTPDLNKILTVQSQLNSLDGLHSQKPAATRLFNYLSQVTPGAATIGDLTTDFTQHTMSITGKSPSLDVVNKFVDSLKFTNYQLDGSSDKVAAFSNVVLSSFSRGSDGAHFVVTLNFDPAIFDNTKSLSLLVPDIITTRSVLEKPTVLFDQSAAPTDDATTNTEGGQ